MEFFIPDEFIPDFFEDMICGWDGFDELVTCRCRTSEAKHNF